MFDLESQIRKWKAHLYSAGSISSSDMEELESHLRDSIDELNKNHIDGEEAFLLAVNEKRFTVNARADVNFTDETVLNDSSQSDTSIYVNYTTSDFNDIYSFIDFDIHPVASGLVLNLENIVKPNSDGKIEPIAAISTSQTYEVSEKFRKKIDATGYVWKEGDGEKIGAHLSSDLFYFREDFHEQDESILLEKNLIEFMPTIVTSPAPPLRAAKVNIQLEFASTMESIRRGTEYAGKNLLYIAGLNIDISEHEEYPATTYFVPWAAYIQLKDGTPAEYAHPVEQDRLFELVMAQESENPEQADLKEQIGRMLRTPRFDIRSPK